MNNIRTLLENVFFAQESKTITLSLANSMTDSEKTVYEVMEKMKNVFKTVGIDNVMYNPDSLTLTVITTDDKEDEIRKIAGDFGATIK
jgi:hypothetical protein